MLDDKFSGFFDNIWYIKSPISHHKSFSLIACLSANFGCLHILTCQPFHYSNKVFRNMLLYDRETCPDTGHSHLRGFRAFKNRSNACSIKRWIPGAHFERAKGTVAEASDYYKKDDDFTEF